MKLVSVWWQSSKFLPKAMKQKEAMLLIIIFILNEISLQLPEKWLELAQIELMAYSLVHHSYRRKELEITLQQKRVISEYTSQESCVQTRPNRRRDLNRKSGFNYIISSSFLQNETFSVYIQRVKYQVIRILEKCGMSECQLMGESLLSRTRNLETIKKS